MNRRGFLYILAKLHAKIIKSKQDTAKSFAHYNVVGACRLLIVTEDTEVQLLINFAHLKLSQCGLERQSPPENFNMAGIFFLKRIQQNLFPDQTDGFMLR